VAGEKVKVRSQKSKGKSEKVSSEMTIRKKWLGVLISELIGFGFHFSTQSSILEQTHAHAGE
jgi:hypothetical protein